MARRIVPVLHLKGARRVAAVSPATRWLTVWGRGATRAVGGELIKGFATGGKPCEVGVWFAFGFARDINLGGARMARYVDGPLRFDAWPEKCRGRVVGVMVAG